MDGGGERGSELVPFSWKKKEYQYIVMYQHER